MENYTSIVDNILNNISIALLFKISIVAVLFVLLVLVLYHILRSPYEYPYYTYHFDVSGKRMPKLEDLIDTYINENGITDFYEHHEMVQDWKQECRSAINKRVLLKKLRQKQFEECLDDKKMFRFVLIRKQTRYTQKNYHRSSYKVKVADKKYSCSYQFLLGRYKRLKEINFECTLNEFYSKNQRKLMTPALRKQIMKRDQYTCQICGKYMPDEVGLHIDHIIPVSRGGKTIPSNLQVLCSKCNGKKSDR